MVQFFIEPCAGTEAADVRCKWLGDQYLDDESTEKREEASDGC